MTHHDGFRTVAAVEWRRLDSRTLTLFDAKTGRPLRKVAIRGLPKDGHLHGPGLWRSGSEITIVYQARESLDIYAADINTGQARRLARYPGHLRNIKHLTLPGITRALE